MLAIFFDLAVGRTRLICLNREIDFGKARQSKAYNPSANEYEVLFLKKNDIN